MLVGTFTLLLILMEMHMVFYCIPLAIDSSYFFMTLRFTYLKLAGEI